MFENFREAYRFRGLIVALVGRHLRMRYRGSVLGFLWSFLNPLCLMLVYTLVFQYYIRFSAVPHYAIFLFGGLLPWIWLSSGLIEGTSAIVASGHLITKSMFPAHVLPLVAILTTGVNFILSLPLLFIFMGVAGMEFSWSLLMLPVLVILQLMLVFGISLGAAALNVQFRDVQHVLANLLTFLFFLCPIVYPASSVPEAWRFTLELNPLSLLIMLYHQVLFDARFPDLWMLGYLGLWAGAMLALGSIIYNRFRDTFAELL